MIDATTIYIIATFHPTIGQHAHQSLRNTTTPELGLIPHVIRVNAGLHIAKVHKLAKPTQQGLPGHQGARKG